MKKKEVKTKKHRGEEERERGKRLRREKLRPTGKGDENQSYQDKKKYTDQYTHRQWERRD